MRTRHKCPECGEICVTDTYHPGIKIVCHSCGELFVPSMLNIVGPGLGIEKPIEKQECIEGSVVILKDKMFGEHQGKKATITMTARLPHGTLCVWFDLEDGDSGMKEFKQGVSQLKECIEIVCKGVVSQRKLNVKGLKPGTVRDALHKTLLEESDKILQEWKDGNCSLERAYNEMHKLWGDEDEPP